MAFRKPASKRVGLKFLLYGLHGSGKTTTALSFPKIAAVDSENGMSLYEGKPKGKNLVLVDNTQSYQELTDNLDNIAEEYEELGIETFATDSESKIYQNIQETIMTVEEKRAKAKGRDVLDTNLSVRSWGKIGQIALKLQNMKIDLTSKGVNYVSVSQAAEIKEKQGDNHVVVGYKPAMDKKAEYDYDVILFHYKEQQANGEMKYFARVEKDRSETFKAGDIIENPDYSMWAAVVDGVKDKEALNTNFVERTETDKAQYETNLEEEEKTLIERMGALFKESEPSVKAKIKADMAAAKIASFDGLTANQQEKLEKIYAKYKNAK